MVLAVDQQDADVDHRISGEHAGLHGFLHTLVDGGDVLRRDRAAFELADELEATAGTGRLE